MWLAGIPNFSHYHSSMFIGHDGKKRSDGEVTVVVYMRKEIIGDDLDHTTLKGLGLTSGMSAALRFFYKQPDILKEQANVFVAPPQTTSTPTEEKTHRYITLIYIIVGIKSYYDTVPVIPVL